MKKDKDFLHTPTPWRVATNNDDVIVDSRNIGIAEIQRKSNPAVSKANIAFIVRAVNAHEELLKTLKWVRRTVHQAHHEGPIEGCRKNTCDAIAQVIAQAEGK